MPVSRDAPTSRTQPSGTSGIPVTSTPAIRLPLWPFVAMFGGFPLWWVLGVVDVMWVPMAAVMALYLQRSGALRAPRYFGVWLLFLAVAGASVMMITSAGDMIGFLYRYAMYLSGTVLFLYVYNARRTLTARYTSGVLTVWWLFTVAGGYLGVLRPGVVIKTPMSVLLPDGIVANDLVNHMVVRRFAQYSADSFFAIAPRPSAPFLYTNNWGSVYSLLLPFVIFYLIQVRHERKFIPLVLMLLVSVIPAALTLNRGMFLGVGVSILYVAIRLALRGRLRALTALIVMGVVGVIVIAASPIQERLEARLSGSANSNTDRYTLYIKSLQLIPDSPLFGFGGPQAPTVTTGAPVGTQGQVWLLLVSHGPIATVCFVGFFVLAFLRVRKRIDPAGITCATVLLVGTMELGYYGFVPNGLPILMIAAALGLRERTSRHT